MTNLTFGEVYAVVGILVLFAGIVWNFKPMWDKTNEDLKKRGH